MVVLAIDALGILARKAERDAPVTAHLHRPRALSGALEFVKIQARQRHIARVCGSIQSAEHHAELGSLICRVLREQFRIGRRIDE